MGVKPRAWGTTMAEQWWLYPTPGVVGRFGNAVSPSADGSRALVGAPIGTGSWDDGGAAAVFLRTGTGLWKEEATFPGGTDDSFGSGVALSADGTRAAIRGEGVVRVFVRDDRVWTEEASLTAPGAEFWGYLSSASVALSADGGWAVVGFPGEDFAGTDSDAAHVFTLSGAAPLPDGVECDGDAACASAACTDGVCCNEDCSGACVACELPGSVGACAPLPEGEDPDDECPGEAAGNGAGACPAPPGSDVDADGDGGADSDEDVGAELPTAPPRTRTATSPPSCASAAAAAAAGRRAPRPERASSFSPGPLGWHSRSR
ncbi:MAG: hypothetical protein HY905_17700 [Deltaproteobacteria bacterium]|nr:hypothetical protein [Deltaproteobacteria bacterium]